MLYCRDVDLNFVNIRFDFAKYICLNMIKRPLQITLFLFLIFSKNLFSQSKTQNRIDFHDAESWILFEDYREALPIYQKLLNIYPDNSNLQYRIGQCYLNIPGEKEKAIHFLEEAVKNMNPGYRDNRFRETGAPYDALYYLANAYRINNQLDKAIETYERFLKELDPEIYDTTIVAFQIQACNNAKILMASPMYIKEDNLGNTINDNNSEYNPVVSDNESMMVFSRRLPFYDAMLYSVKVNGQWTDPRNMNEILKVDKNIYPASLSSDGKVLYLYNSENYDGNIFTTTFSNDTWSPIIKLNDNINTKYWESHAVISHDNRKLYFTSNRKGTLGGLDIWVSRRDSIGNWGIAANLGPVINTQYNEETPFLSRDDRTLFFSSRGHMSMGGHDIFYSTLLDNGQWSVPMNAGYPLNSTDDDIFFMPLNQGYEGYYSRLGSDGFGRQDIYRLEIFSDNHPRKFMVRGIVRVADLNLKTDDKIRVRTFNIRNPGLTSDDYADPQTGEYELTVTHGDHTLIYETNGTQRFKRDIHLPLTSKADSFIIPPTVLPKSDFAADLDVGDLKTITAISGDTLVIPVKAEPNSSLTVQYHIGDSLISEEKFNTRDPSFEYKMIPEAGSGRLTFKLTDQYMNTASEEIIIEGKRTSQKQRIIRRPEHPEILAEKRAAAISMMEKTAKTGTEKEQKSANDQNVTLPTSDENDMNSCRLWYLWLIAGAGIIFLIILLAKRRRRNKEHDDMSEDF